MRGWECPCLDGDVFIGIEVDAGVIAGKDLVHLCLPGVVGCKGVLLPVPPAAAAPAWQHAASGITIFGDLAQRYQLARGERL